ncbi:MAG: lamin tail domain-containing protein [Methanoregula sp.]|nr:lamin tail domain-containing protein [Methanoregula sp.]
MDAAVSGMYRASVSAVIVCILVSCGITAGCLEHVLLPVVNPSGHTHLADNGGNLSVWFLDAGQGDSTLFVIDGKTILVDAGEIDRGDQIIRDLQALGVTRIDLLVATHPHSDHIGGMQEVLATFPTGQVLDAGLPSTSPVYEHLLETIEEKNIPYRLAVQGQEIEADPAVHVLVLWPAEQRFGGELNTDSVVLRISYGAIDFLMTGDLDSQGEEALLRSGYPLDAEILKVGHHGSFSSTSPPFLARVRPEMAVIPVGADNPYGHPHQQTLDLLKDYGVAVYRTDRDGNIMVRTDGMSYSVTTKANTSGSRAVTTAKGIIPVPVFTLPILPEQVQVPLPSFTLPRIPSDLTIPDPVLTIPSLGNSSSVYISAVQFNAPGDDRQNLNGEWVQLTNRGDGLVLLAGWTLSDATGVHPYIFPAFILMPESSVSVCTGSGRMNDTALFMDRNEPLWDNDGDVATLKDISGNIIDRKS